MTSDRNLSEKDATGFFATDESIVAFNANQELYACEERLFRMLPDKASILDLGCGTGRTTKFLIEGGHNVVGIDIAFKMLGNAAGKIRTPFLCADAISLPFRDSSFDVALFSYNGIDYIHPYENRLKCLKEIRRVLRKDGIFIFSSHNNAIPRNLSSVIPFLTGFPKRGRSRYITDKSYKWGEVTIFLTTPAAQVRELHDAGFTDVQIHPRRYSIFRNNPLLLGIAETWTYYWCRT